MSKFDLSYDLKCVEVVFLEIVWEKIDVIVDIDEMINVVFLYCEVLKFKGVG